MRVALAWALALTAPLACGGSSGSASVDGADPEAIRTAPAGIAALAFLDLERLGLDQLGPAAALPGCVRAAPAAGAASYAFQCPAAGSGQLTGSVSATPVPNIPGAYTLAYDLTVTAAILPGQAAPAWTWSYRGQAAVQVTGATATLTVPRPTQPAAGGLKLVYTDNLHPANGKSFDFSASLTASWTGNPRRLALQGSYALDQEGIQVIACSIAPGNPLVWSSCDFPDSGGLDLDQLPVTGGPVQAQATFTGCGSMTLAGARFRLGG